MKGRTKAPIGGLRPDPTADVAFLLLVFFIANTIHIEVKNAITPDRRPFGMNRLEPAVVDRVEDDEQLVVLLMRHPKAGRGVVSGVLESPGSRRPSPAVVSRAGPDPSP